jgi:DoxX-like family
MNTITWIMTAVLAAIFTFSGIAKSTMSRERLIATGQTGIAPFPMPVVRAVAVAELFAVAALFAPWLSGTARVLTPLAAIGLVGVMIGAAVSHASLREPKAVAANVTLLALASFVAASRFAELS